MVEYGTLHVGSDLEDLCVITRLCMEPSASQRQCSRNHGARAYTAAAFETAFTLTLPDKAFRIEQCNADAILLSMHELFNGDVSKQEDRFTPCKHVAHRLSTGPRHGGAREVQGGNAVRLSGSRGHLRVPRIPASIITSIG